MDPAKEKDIEEEYLSSLMDLNVNSKPLINMLTMLAEDNIEYAHVIVKAVEKHLAKVSPDVKLPILYLIDSIVKNVGNKYKQLFAQNIVNMFCGVFEKVNEKVREKMFNLRQTWSEVFPQTKLYALDVKVNVMDPNWPITAKIVPKSVHVNPNFLKGQPAPSAKNPAPQNRAEQDIFNQMKQKERELLELKQRKIELELMVTTKKIAESERELRGGPVNSKTAVMPVMNAALNNNIPPQMPHNLLHPPAPGGRVRIAPVNPAMILSGRSRDPRLARARPTAEAGNQDTRVPAPMVIQLGGSSMAKSLPRIPKYSHSNNHKSSNRDNDERDRDTRSRRNKEESSSKSSNKSPSSKDKKSSSKSSNRSSDRKNNGSSDDSSPRKRGDDDKKSSKASHHRSSHASSRSSKSPSKPPTNIESRDVDFRMPAIESNIQPDSTTSISKLDQIKALGIILNGDVGKPSHEVVTSEDNEERRSELRDVDLRFTEGGKKRSMSPSESEPITKKNRSDTDILFGNKDVDLRNLGEPSDRKSKSKEKSDFEAVRAKLNATKEKSKMRGGIKLLDEHPAMPASENGTAKMIEKLLGRKEKAREEKEPEDAPMAAVEVPEPVKIVPPQKQSRFTPIDNDERMDDVADLGNLTAKELRQSSIVPASIRKEKRRGSKWNQPTPQWPVANAAHQTPGAMPPHNQILPQHFVNPWETNPMILAMQKQTQMPLVVPQSTSHPVLNNKMRTLRLDGTKDHLLRFYKETAIIFNDVGEPHDIKFSLGQSRIVIDDLFSANLNFNDIYKSIVIDGTTHQVKFGSPTRELYIDDNFYECYFNNQPTQIVLNDTLRMVRIEGKAPEVKIGRKRKDLVLGLINIVIDAEIMVPVFLDTTIQYFEFKGKIFTLQFADFFLSVVINNEPFKVEFGGLPKNFTLNGQKHFIRFTGLPENVAPGRVNMRGMRRTHLFKNCRSPPLIEPLDPNDGLDINHLIETNMRGYPRNDNMMLHSNPLASNMIPGIGHEAQGAPAIGVPDMDINDLLKKLVANGIIGGSGSGPSVSGPSKNGKKDKSPDRPEDSRKGRTNNEEKRSIVPVSLMRPETVKKRQQGIVDTLYSGIQCSSCGLRFPPEQTMKYSQHLDWHFRQNRRERDSKRRAHFRKWYYNQSDWIKYEEIEDLEEREKNFFETQQMESMDQGDDSNAARAGANQESTAEVSCPAGADDVNRSCDMCHDQFTQFFNEETEEWNLRSALKIDDKFYHPICYEDFKASLTLDETALNADNTKVDEDDDDDVQMQDDESTVIKAEKTEEPDQLATHTGEDDDDVIVLPTEEPVVTEIMDESEIVDAVKTSIDNDMNVTDDDVMIQEPKIETQLVPDDDEDDYEPNPTTSEELIVKIKEEPKDDGYEDLVNEEDAFVEVTAIANDDLMQDDAFINSPKAPFQPAQDENAVFDEVSSLMMSSPGAADELSRDVDDDNNSRPESSGPALIGGKRKLKIVLSSLAQNSFANKNLNTNSNVNDQNENSNLDSVNKLDSNSVELQSDVHKDQPMEVAEEPEIEYQVKTQLQGVKFVKNSVPVKRGFENSGLCSIM